MPSFSEHLVRCGMICQNSGVSSNISMALKTINLGVGVGLAQSVHMSSHQSGCDDNNSNDGDVSDDVRIELTAMAKIIIGSCLAPNT